MQLIEATMAYRSVLGAAAYVAPARTATALGIDPAANPAHDYLARVFGARDIALGVAGLLAPPDVRRRYIALLACIDAADLASAVLAGRRGTISPVAATLLGVAALAALIPELRELA